MRKPSAAACIQRAWRRFTCDFETHGFHAERVKHLSALETFALLREPHVVECTRRATMRVLRSCGMGAGAVEHALHTYVAAVLMHTHTWRLIEDRRTAMALRTAASALLEAFEGEGLERSADAQGFVSALEAFQRQYESWRALEPQVQLLERAMELVSLQCTLEASRSKKEGRGTLATMQRVYQAKRKHFEVQTGGTHAVKLLNAWAKATKAVHRHPTPMRFSASGLGPNADMRQEDDTLRQMTKLHGLLLGDVPAQEPSNHCPPALLTVKEWVAWELLCMQLLLQPTPHCGRLRRVLGALQQELRGLRRGAVWVDVDVVQDVIESGLWTESCCNELVRTLLESVWNEAGVQTRWDALCAIGQRVKAQNGTDGSIRFWVVWLCACLQFVQNEVDCQKRALEQERRNMELATLFSEGIRREQRWFSTRYRRGSSTLVETDQWLKEGVAVMMGRQAVDPTLVSFQRQWMLQTLLKPEAPLPEVMVLDTPHVLTLRAHVDFWMQALAMIKWLAESPFSGQMDVLMQWLVAQRPPLNVMEGVERLMAKCDAAVESERLRQHFADAIADGACVREAATEVMDICVNFVERLHLPQAHVLWILFGACQLGPQLMRMLRLIHVNFRVHHRTYAQLLSGGCGSESPRIA